MPRIVQCHHSADAVDTQSKMLSSVVHGSPVRARFILRAASIVLFTIVALPLDGAEVVLKNGTILEGTPAPIAGLTAFLSKQQQLSPVPNDQLLMIEDGMRRYFVFHRQAVEIDRSVELARDEVFELPQRRTGRKLMVASVGSFQRVEPFNASGHRKITLTTDRGPLEIIQGITELTPKFIKITALEYEWEYAIATTSLRVEVLDPILRTAAAQRDGGGPLSSTSRMAIARFYMQAELYDEADRELQSVLKEFPDLASTIEPIVKQLHQVQADWLLREIDVRRNAGQHALAIAVAKSFPTDRMNAQLQRRVKELVAEYDGARDRADHALARLSELQGEIDAERQGAVTPLRSVIGERLDFNSLERLDSFLKLEADPNLSAREKLALAYSGWVLGSANASTELDTAIRLWQAQFLALEYLRTRDLSRCSELLRQIREVEGVSAETIARMVPLLPPVIETPEAQPTQAAEIKLAGDSEKTPRGYSILLPPEYRPTRSYPLILALHPSERMAADELDWWGGTAENPGQAQRYGYIVVAPHYAAQKQIEFDYSAESHELILESMRDAMRRFRVDADRVILAGHGMGANAAFDVATAHPDLFAGVVAISGYCDKFCKWTWKNARNVPWYVVNGELDLRQGFEANYLNLDRMLRIGFDLIYTQYIGRGYDSYYSEIHAIFDWMNDRRRVHPVKEFEAQVLRASDRSYYWLDCDGLPVATAASDVMVDNHKLREKPIKPLTLKARIADAADETATIYIHSGAPRHTLWLSPEMLDYDKRLSVQVRGRSRFNNFPRADIEAMLDDLKFRGDREMLFWTRISLD